MCTDFISFPPTQCVIAVGEMESLWLQMDRDCFELIIELGKPGRSVHTAHSFVISLIVADENVVKIQGVGDDVNEWSCEILGVGEWVNVRYQWEEILYPNLETEGGI